MICESCGEYLTEETAKTWDEDGDDEVVYCEGCYEEEQREFKTREMMLSDDKR